MSWNPNDKQEFVVFRGMQLVVHTSTVDWATWGSCYTNGYREPRYPLPAIPMRAVIDHDYVDISAYEYDELYEVHGWFTITLYLKGG